MNGPRLWMAEGFLPGTCFLVVTFIFRREQPHRHAFRRRIGGAPQDLPRTIAHSSQARDPHTLLPEMDSRGARPHRPDHGFDGAEIYRGRTGAVLAARPARRL